MKDNTKITLALEQLKRLVKETSQNWLGPDFFTEGEMLIEYRGPGGDVVVPEGILSIAMPAFEGKRDKITSLSLPATLVQIAPSSLSFLRNIKSYSVADGNPKFSSKNGMLLSKDGETLLQGIGGDAIIPDGVKEIDDEAFAFLNLKSVVIPEGVTSIGEVAFCGCEDLTKVVIPASVETIKEDAFRDCACLNKVNILNPKLRDEVMQDPSRYFHGTPWSSTEGNFMKNINENTKITLTIGQLKRLVKERSDHDPDMSTVAKELHRNLSYEFYWNMKSTGGDTTPEIKRDEVDKYVPEEFWTKLAEVAVNDGADKATDMFVDLFLQNYDKIVGGKFYFEKTLRINVKREIERATAELFQFRDQPKNEAELIAKLDKEIADAKASGATLPPQWVLDEYKNDFELAIKRYIDGRRDGGGVMYGWGIKDYGTGKWSKWVKDNWQDILYLIPKEVENILKYNRGNIATEFGERIVEVLTGLVDKRNILLTSVNPKDKVDHLVDYLNDCCAPSEPANLYARVDGGSNYDGYPSSYVDDDEREQKARASADKLVKGINAQLADRPFNGKTLTVTNVGTKYTKVRTHVDNGDDGQEWYAYPIALKLTYGDGSPIEDEMKINENSKITLTIGQLRKLVKESLDGDFPKILGTACRSIKFDATDLVDYFDGWYKAEEAGDKKEALIYLRQIKNAGANIDQMLDDIRNLDIGDTPAISGWKGGPVTEDGDASAAFDISGAIMAGNLKFEGLNDSKRWRSLMAPSDAGRVAFGGKPRAAVGAPSPLNAKLFDVCLFQQEGEGWLNLDLHFDMGHIAVRYFYSKNKNLNPWANYRRPSGVIGELRKIDEQLANDIKNNPDLLRALKEYVEYNAPSNNDPAGNNARKMQEMLEKYSGVGTYIDAWNRTVDSVNKEKDNKKEFEETQAWADQEYASHKFSYYREYYRGPNAIAHDDDYEGSGSISPSEIVRQVGLRTQAAAKKYLDNLVDSGACTFEEDHYRTFFRCTH